MKQTKICRTCKKEKPLQEFYKEKKNSLYRNSDCIICQKLILKKWRLDNTLHIKEHSYNYYHKHKEQIQYTTQHWRITHKDHMKKYSSNYYKTEYGKEVAARTKAKRKRNLGFNKLYPNPFPSDIKVHWHHINNNDVVAIPVDLHIYYNKNHRENMKYIVEQIYKVELEAAEL